MKILAIDTSTDYLSLAVVSGDAVLAAFHRKVPRAHSSLLVPTIDAVLQKAKVKIADIGLIALSIGPGSFTGLRISAVTVKGLAYCLGTPVVPVPTLDVIAANGVKRRGIICPVLDARKNKVYACLYRSDGQTLRRLSTYLLLPLAELAEKVKRYAAITFLGDAVEKEMLAAAGLRSSGTAVAKWHPRAAVVARLGLALYAKGKTVQPADLEPMYIYSRECDIIGR